MNRAVVMVGLFVLLCVQAATYSPLQVFSWDVHALLFLETVLFLSLTLAVGGSAFAFFLLTGIFLFRFWHWFVSGSWLLTQVIHGFSGLLLQGWGGAISVTPEGLRIAGRMVAADPTKTAAFFFLLMGVVYFLFSVFWTGFWAGLKRTGMLAAVLLPFAVIRWLGVGFLGSALNPDLGWTWQMFWGAGLLLTISPLFLLGDDPLTFPETHERFGESLWFWGGLFLLIAGLQWGLTLGTRVPRILVDESHSGWNPLHSASPDEMVGSLTDHHFDHFLARLSTVGSVTIAVLPGSGTSLLATGWSVLEAPELSPEVLSPETFDLVILKGPTIRYSSREKRALQEFVSAGKTLHAIGERDDAFFMNSRLNDLLLPMGAHLGRDGVVDHLGREIVTWGPLHAPLPFSPGPEPYWWPAAASIRDHSGVVPLIVSPPNAVSASREPGGTEADVAVSGWNHQFGPFVLAGMMTWGKGKVIVHGGARHFNASLLPTGGKEVWLKRLVSATHLSGIVMVLLELMECLFFFYSCLVLSSSCRHRKPAKALVILTVLGLVTTGPMVFRPSPGLEGGNTLAVDLALGHQLDLGSGAGGGTLRKNSLSSLLTPLQIRGFRLYHQPSFPRSGWENPPLAMILADPARAPEPAQMAWMTEYVAGGGVLILLTAGQLKGPARMVALGLGLSEGVGANGVERQLPDLVGAGGFAWPQSEKPRFTVYAMGKGKIILGEFWDLQTGSPASFARQAEFLEQHLRSETGTTETPPGGTREGR